MEEQVLETWGKPTGGLNNAMGIKDSRRMPRWTGRMKPERNRRMREILLLVWRIVFPPG